MFLCRGIVWPNGEVLCCDKAILCSDRAILCRNRVGQGREKLYRDRGFLGRDRVGHDKSALPPTTELGAHDRYAGVIGMRSRQKRECDMGIL